MADLELPADYDAIILGTGMTECIIAAALSRIGWKVLHLDRYDYYSGDWATFNFEGLLNWIKYNQDTAGEEKLKAKEFKTSDILKDGERSLPLSVNSNNISNVKDAIHVSEEELSETESKEVDVRNEVPDNAIESNKSLESDSEKVSMKGAAESGSGEEGERGKDEEGESAAAEEDAAIPSTESKESKEKKEDSKTIENSVKKWTFKEIKANWRKFSIDLAPRILYCRGPMVELLISSDIAKYCTFRNITRVLTQFDRKLEQVPCSRSDVFSSKRVSMIEKRMLMKLLTFAIEFEKHPQEYSDFSEKPFSEFLISKKLSPNVQHYVHNAIAMATKSTNTLEGLLSTQKFLQSLGRYGNTAFLWPLYGSGELPQCFCRMCAVFGGIYCLRRSGAHLLIDSENKCTGIIDTEGQRLNARYVVMETSFASKELLPSTTEDQRFISRAIFLTDRSILPSDKDQISLLCLPPVHENGSYITLYELSHLSCACPKDIYVVQISCRGVKSAEEDLRPTVDSLFSFVNNDGDDAGSKPLVLWSLFYEQKDPSDLKLPENSPEGVFVVPSADLALDFDEPIRLAKEIFDKLCPGEEFLPKAPNPEDIVFEDEGMAKDQGSGFEAPGSEDQSEAGQGSQASGPGKEREDADHEAKAIVGDSNELTSQEGSTTHATNEEKHKSGSVENQSQNSCGSSHVK